MEKVEKKKFNKLIGRIIDLINPTSNKRVHKSRRKSFKRHFPSFLFKESEKPKAENNLISNLLKVALKTCWLGRKTWNNLKCEMLLLAETN